MIRLVLSDLDNTLVPYGQPHVSERAIAAVHALAEKGVRFAPASGRGIGDLRHYFRDDDACVSTALTCDGLEIFVDGALAMSKPFAHDTLVRAARACAGVPGAGLVVFCESGGSRPYLVGMGDGTNPYLDNRQVFPFGYASADEVPDELVVKTGVTFDAAQCPTAELAALLGRACPELDFILSIVDWFDINPHGWSKADGVRILADELGISLDEVVVFGDQANDLEMLELVPNSCAVANAVPAAAAAARWHIGDCADEAVARAMEQICEVAGTDEPPAFMRG